MTDSTDGRARQRTNSTGSERAAAMRHGRKKRRSRRTLTTLSIIGGLVVVLAVAGGWVGLKALNAKSSLEHAQTLVGTIKTQAGAMDFAGIGETSKELSRSTKDAVDQTHDPVWRIAEFIPFAGKNLTVVRQLASRRHRRARRRRSAGLRRIRIERRTR